MGEGQGKECFSLYTELQVTDSDGSGEIHFCLFYITQVGCQCGARAQN